MNKKGQYALNGALIGLAAKLLINGIKQYQRMEENPEEKFDWGEFLLEGGKGTLIGGGIGFGVGAIADEINIHQEPINTDEYLNGFVSSIQINRNFKSYKARERKCNEIISFLEKEFSEELSATPFIWGSNAKGTAIDDNYDFDIFTRFRRNSFSIEEMHNETYHLFNNDYTDKALNNVRKQEKSIGLIFNIYGEEVKIDIVPQRDRNDDPNDTSGNLYVKRKNWFSEPSYTKTDVGLQATEKLTPTHKKLIMILKKWKNDNGVPISSYMIQIFVLRAYMTNKHHIPKKLTDKLLMVVEFIYWNIDIARLVSIENTNNVVNDISDSDKATIKREMKRIMERVEYQPNSIQNIFSLD